ncbi:MAG TPA: ABC transporter substrate-binding protein [Chloroflexota bacterium]|nr:ABC transporter substrate-binding protein [Chloroflexota bacterium]
MKRLLLVILTVLTLAAPGAARARSTHHSLFPVTVVDDHGNHVRIPTRPNRLVTLFPGQTEILFALGLENRIVADGSKYVEGATDIAAPDGKSRDFRYPSEWPSKLGRDYPVKAPNLVHVEGGCCGTDFNLETIESVHPDLVFAPYIQTELGTYQKMRELGLKVIILDPASLNGILHDITLVGRATGAISPAHRLVQTLKAQMRQVRNAVRHVKNRPRVYYEIDATNPTAPYTAGPGTFIDDAISLAGGKNVADAVTTCRGTLCYPQLELESLVQMNPQIIVLGDSNYGTKPADVKARPGWESISAVQTGRIYPFNDDLISRAGPRIMIGVRRLLHLIHPNVRP